MVLHVADDNHAALPVVTVGGAQNLAGSRNIATRGTDARELCKEEWFLEELSLLNSDGEPLFKHEFARSSVH